MGWSEPEVYAVKHRNEEVRRNSQSGGMFTALSDEVLRCGGVVYGCVMSAEFQAMHIRAEDKETRDHMRGSKYIQSKLGDAFLQVRSDLEEGRKVLFSGTSCQVAGLRTFLQKQYENLYCVDIICHGVPSPAVWRAYLQWQERKNGDHVVMADMRDKRNFGWHGHVESLTFADGKVVSSKIFARLFYGHRILRPSCYCCPYKKSVHPGDITIGDYWGIEKTEAAFDDNKGVSLVLVNNDHGAEMFRTVRDGLLWIPKKLADSMQIPLMRPYDAPADRARFWSDYQKKSFDRIVKKYGHLHWITRFKRRLKRMIG